MATVITDDSNYEKIADAIRAANGTDETYTPAQMSVAIMKLNNETYILNKIMDPETYPISDEITTTPIPTEVGGIVKEDGTLDDSDADATRPVDFVSINPGISAKIISSKELDGSIRVIFYDENYSYLSFIYAEENVEFETPSDAYYLKFYKSRTDLTYEFSIVQNLTKKVEYKKLFIADHGYAIYGDIIDDETMHKLVIHALGKNANSYNITELRAPDNKPEEATLALMNSGAGTVQFVDISSMRYGLSGQGSLSIVCQSRGDTPLPQIRFQFNNGNDEKRVSKLSIDPDAIPMRFTSSGIQVKRNNKYTDTWYNNETVDIDLVEMSEKINAIYDVLVNNGTITPINKTITYPYEPCIEYGKIDSTTGSNVELGREYDYLDLRTRDYIPCSFSANYAVTVNVEWTVFYYDSEKNLISTTTVADTPSIITPSNASYMRLCTSNSIDLAETLIISREE